MALKRKMPNLNIGKGRISCISLANEAIYFFFVTDVSYERGGKQPVAVVVLVTH